jgi:hypothetical protein
MSVDFFHQITMIYSKMNHLIPEIDVSLLLNNNFENTLKLFILIDFRKVRRKLITFFLSLLILNWKLFNYCNRLKFVGISIFSFSLPNRYFTIALKAALILIYSLDLQKIESSSLFI